MPKVRHLAIAARNPRRLADFYRQALELQTVQESESAISLSDGTINLVLLPLQPDQSQGLDHIGFQVEEVEAMRQRLQKSGKEVPPPQRPDDRFYPEFRIADPDGNGIVFSAQGLGVSEERTPFPIRHIALYTPDPQRLADFYGNVFQMKKVSSTDRASIFVSDGHLNLALLSQRPEERLGLHHFGFHVQSIEEAQRRLARAGVGAGEQRPSRIPYAEYRVEDPEGNGFDISEKGWEV